MAHPRWVAPIKKAKTVAEFEDYVTGFVFMPWRPSGMTLHNTGAPSLAQRPQGFLQVHMDNLEVYFRDQRGWSGAPHLFVDEDQIWLFNPLNRPGVHSPSYNGTHLGVELLGDFSREDDDSGRGAQVVKTAVAAFAILHAKLGLDPEKIKFHKDDPLTTHDCPGKDLFEDKLEFINAVKGYMGSGGDWTGLVPDKRALGTVKTPKLSNGSFDTLNMRDQSSARGAILKTLENNARVEILGSAMNVTTKWLRINHAGTFGWVSAAYILEER